MITDGGSTGDRPPRHIQGRFPEEARCTWGRTGRAGLERRTGGLKTRSPHTSCKMGTGAPREPPAGHQEERGPRDTRLARPGPPGPARPTLPSPGDADPLASSGPERPHCKQQLLVLVLVTPTPGFPCPHGGRRGGVTGAPSRRGHQRQRQCSPAGAPAWVLEGRVNLRRICLHFPQLSEAQRTVPADPCRV